MKLSSIASAGTLAVVAALAGTYAPLASADPVATFSSDVNGIFSNDLDLAAGLFRGNLTFSLVTESGPVAYFSAILDGTGYDLGGMAGQNASFTAMVDATRPFALTVFGYSGNLDTLTDAPGRYTLSITTAVPEPATWALLMSGVLVLGVSASARRSRRSAFAVR